MGIDSIRGDPGGASGDSTIRVRRWMRLILVRVGSDTSPLSDQVDGTTVATSFDFSVVARITVSHRRRVPPYFASRRAFTRMSTPAGMFRFRSSSMVFEVGSVM